MRSLVGNGGMPKETAKLVRAARTAGWTVRFTGRNHVLLRSPEGAVVVTAGTPSSPRTHTRLVADLRRAGFDPSTTNTRGAQQ